MITTSPDGSTYPAQRTLEDGDEMNGDNFLAVFSDAAQRAEFLKLAIDTLNAGVKKIRAVASVAAMTGATGMAGGDVVLLANVANLGIFMYVAGAIIGTNIPGWRYDSTTAAGYWIRLEWPLYNDGVQVVRKVDSLIALKALVGMKNGHLAIYHNGNFPRLYHFVETGSPPSTITDFLYPADDSTGFWASELWWLVGQAFTFGALTADDTTVNGSLAVSTDANIQGDATAATLAIGGALDSGKKLSVHGAAKIHGALDLVGGGLSTDGNLGAAGDLSIEGNAALQGNASIDGTLAVGGVFTGKGRFRRRVKTLALDADTTVSVASHDLVYLPSGVLSADRTLTVDTTGAVEGDVIRVASEETVHFLSVEYGLESTPLKLDSVQRRWLELTYVGSKWVLSGLGDKS